MKQLFTFLACLFITNLATAQCTPAPAFSVTSAKLANQPLRVKASITTGSVSWPLVHEHAIYWGDGNSDYPSSSPSTTYHNYSSPGTYLVKYYLVKIDSSTSMMTCYDSTSQSITVAYCNGGVYGFIDSMQTVTPYQMKFNAWGTPASGGSFFWLFGDGGTGSGNPATHTYANGTTRTVTLYSIGSGCTDTFTKNVSPVGRSCNGKNALFSETKNGLQVTFNNNSTPGGIQVYDWDFGDGNGSSLQNPVHVYASAGTYTVTLITEFDSLCHDTISHSVTVGGGPNIIQGYIWKDSTVSPINPDYKVWLIVMDSSMSTLTAVDSLTITGGSWGMDLYQFNNKPVGDYRVKAAITNGPSSGTGYVPTYSTSSLSWSTATVINHYGGNSQGNYIQMQTGTITGGPGFVGGNVSMGANKGTGSGIPGLNVYLIDATTGKLVKFATTDMNGDYSFSNVPTGTYQLQPEMLGFTTTPSTAFQISNTKTKVENMWFVASNSKKTIKPVPSSVANVADRLSFNIYPNPAKNKTTIQWNSNSTANAAIVITDITGKKVYSNTVKATHETEIDLSQLRKGLYFINISSENNQQTQKLVVE